MSDNKLVKTILDAAALTGIVSVIGFSLWAKFTIEAFKFSWHILSNSPEKETYKAVTRVMCEECKEFFDEENRCFTCRGD